MRDYAKLSPFFWVRGSGRRLRGDAIAQVVAAYLSTCPASNMVGIFYVSKATIADDTGHTIDEIREALERIEEVGYAHYDRDERLVWIPNHARFEIGATMKPGDKRRKRLLAELAHVAEHRFAAEFVAAYGSAYGLGLDDLGMGHLDSDHLPEGASTNTDGASSGQEGASSQPDGASAVGRQNKGHPTSKTKPDGASADLGQDRTGQDRTGQGKGASQSPIPSPSESGSRVLHPDEPLTDSRAGYVETVRMNTGEDLDARSMWARFVNDRIERSLLYASEGAIDAGWRKWVDREATFAKKNRMAGAGRISSAALVPARPAKRFEVYE